MQIKKSRKPIRLLLLSGTDITVVMAISRVKNSALKGWINEVGLLFVRLERYIVQRTYTQEL